MLVMLDWVSVFICVVVPVIIGELLKDEHSNSDISE